MLRPISATHLPPDLAATCEALRGEVRTFLREALPDQSRQARVARARNWSFADPEFSRKLGARGWIGMTWPKALGGHARSQWERYVVVEELLAAGAPVGAHWIADRQSAPLLMRLAPDTWAKQLLPGIARGETYFCIGMSEPNSGSDLASIRTRGERVKGGWLINGTKIWTSGAHRAHYMIALVRTRPQEDGKHGGLSQFLIDLNNPNITRKPFRNVVGEADFNEVAFIDAFVPDACLLGNEGEGWSQVTAELAFERSGPERYLSSTQLLLEMLDAADAQNPSDPRDAVAIGRLTARYATLRQLSLGIAGMLARGENPAVEAALVKDQGALIEQAMPGIAHDLFADRALPESSLAQVLDYTTRAAVSYSLRGGTREILRGIIARGLDLK